jgi:hypothetical protein
MSSPDGEFDETMALLSMNGLKYQAPESISATSNRVRTQINFNPNAYFVDTVGGVQPSLLMNVGSSFINGMQSMVNVTMTVNTTGGSNAAYFAFGNNTERADGVTSVNSNGSFLNLISDLTVQSKSGELLVRELYKNQNQTQKLYKIDKQRRGVLATMGGSVEVAGGGLKFPIYPVNKPVTFSIPLSELTSLFGSSELLPPQLLSGSIMRMTIAPPATALVFYDNTGLDLANSAPSVTLNLKNMSCYLDQYELFDKASSLILSSALSNETSGLKYSYLTQFNTIVNPTGSSFSFDIQLSAAKLQSLVLKFVPKTTWTGIVDGGTGANKFDPTAAATLCDLSTNAGNVGDPNSLGFSIQTRIGNLVMPLFAINSATDMFQQSYNALNPISYSGCDDIDPLKVINKLSPCCVSYPEYTRTVDKSALDPRQRNGVGTGCNIFAFTFERSSAVNVSGVSTNNSRILSVQVDNCANAANMQLYASVTYIAVANVSNENVVLNK